MTVRNCIKCGLLFDARQCPACHIKMTKKWLANNIDKTRETKKRWYAANRESQKAYAKAFASTVEYKDKKAKRRATEANRKKERASCAKWHAEHSEQRKAYGVQWRKEHPDLVRLRSRNRRARKKSNGGTLSSGLIQKLLKLQRGKCACCGVALGDNYHLDHIVPLALGGANEDWNVQLLRARCNQQKNMKHPIDFMQSRGFLL